MRHPAVAACVVLPIQQSHTLFRLKAVVTPRDPRRPPSADALRDFARQSLAPHKVPRLFEFRAALPRSATGKILRHLVSLSILFALLLLPLTGGCAHQPDLPTYPGLSDSAALKILADRGRSVHTVSGQGSLELTQPDGQSIRLEAAVALRPPDHVRLRAWKFGQAVLDLTITPQGVWIVAPDTGKRKERIRASSARAAEFAKAWSLFTLFDRPGVTTADRGQQTLVRQTSPGRPAILCYVDRPTLTPRRYEIQDDAGKTRFSLDLDHYANLQGIPWPRRMTAVGPNGKIVLDLRDLELNGDIPAGAFTPPPRAQRLP
jgi:outer membrane lipoprotein-sorting protein